MKNTNYLKEELYELIKTDASIFDFIQESSLDGLWYWDLEQPEEEWMNPKFWSVLGYDHRKMPHKASAWKDIIYPEDLKLAMDEITKHFKNPDHPYDQTVRYTHKNGSTVWIRCRGLAIRDKHDKPLRMLGAHQEITELKNKELKNKELKLEQNTTQLRNTQQISKIGSWELDLKTNEVIWTEELYNMYGFDPGLPPPVYTEQMKLFTAESWENLTSSVDTTRETGIPYELEELRTIRKDGSNGWIWARGEAVFDTNKEIIGLQGVAQDITEKKILELEKEALIKRLNYALDASGDGIWDWTPSDGVTIFSKAWVEMLGYEVGELAFLASEWSDRLHPNDVEWVFTAINKITQTPKNGDTFSHDPSNEGEIGTQPRKATRYFTPFFHRKRDLTEKSKELGIRFRLNKPVKSQDLFNYLSHHDQTLETTPLNETKQTIHASPTTEKIKILIAEDNPLNMMLSKTMLSQLMPNSEIYEAKDGLEALDQYKRISPDLIFMDVHMPELDGIEVTKKIRALEVNHSDHLPIVALTAGALKEEKEKCLAAGMDDFLTKPLEFKKIQSVLNKFFNQGKKANGNLQNIDVKSEIHF